MSPAPESHEIAPDDIPPHVREHSDAAAEVVRSEWIALPDERQNDRRPRCVFVTVVGKSPANDMQTIALETLRSMPTAGTVTDSLCVPPGLIDAVASYDTESTFLLWILDDNNGGGGDPAEYVFLNSVAHDA